MKRCTFCNHGDNMNKITDIVYNNYNNDKSGTLEIQKKEQINIINFL
jgi:hypothetical protein